MKYIIKAYCISEYGQRKDAQGNPHQEDSTYPAADRLTDNARTFILCDGMGGHDAGEVASATVCDAMGNAIANDGHDQDGVFTPEDFSDALAAAFDALDQKDNGAPKKMGTTMTFLKLHNAGATIAHIGDSRVYHIRPGKTGEDTEILFQTQDHSLINDLIKVGELTKEEAQSSRQKNVITRAMQPNMERRPNADIHQISDIRPGDYFYMCSDGMLEQTEMENGESLKNIFSKRGGNDQNKVQILKSVTDDNKDNHTAFIIHIIDVAGQQGSAPEPKGDRMAIVDDEPEKKSKSGIIGFLAAAVVVAAVFIGFSLFKPKSDDNKGKMQEIQQAIKEQSKENDTHAITQPEPTNGYSDSSNNNNSSSSSNINNNNSSNSSNNNNSSNSSNNNSPNSSNSSSNNSNSSSNTPASPDKGAGGGASEPPRSSNVNQQPEEPPAPPAVRPGQEPAPASTPPTEKPSQVGQTAKDPSKVSKITPDNKKKKVDEEVVLSDADKVAAETDKKNKGQKQKK